MQYVMRIHENSRKAVILIPGNGSIPNDYFTGGNTYLNAAGKDIFDEGFDVFSPYITHSSRFQNSRRRLASLSGERWEDHDVQRIVILLERLAKKYDEIHIAGVSTGGMLAIRSYRTFTQAFPEASKRIGVVVSVEGWQSGGHLIKKQEDSLFRWNWEMAFPGIDKKEFDSIANTRNVFLAFGSCNEGFFKPIYSKFFQGRVLRYQGAHEFKVDVFFEALKRWRKRVSKREN